MPRSPRRSSVVSRWRTARGAAALVAALALVGGGLAACSAGGSSPDSSTAAKTSLRFGIPGGSTGTVLDPHVLTDALNTWFAWSFFETIGIIDQNNEYQNVLAESFTPNEDASVWTLVLKDGITFHSGKPLTADDVIFTFNRILDPATAATGAGNAAVIGSMDRIDDKTVRFNLLAPRGAFPQTLSDGSTMGIIPTDFDISKPDSTGPWVFESYDPGVEVRVKRYDGYHGSPAKLAELAYVALPDPDARLNALISGQIDVDGAVDPANLPRVENDPNLRVTDLPSGAFELVTMRVDQGPTGDPRVREALRLAVDREQIITVVDGGMARVGNDLYGIDDPNFRADLVRTRDVEKAKALVAEAGATGAAMTLYTIVGIEPMAQIVAQNAREIGLNVTVEVRDDAVYYADGYLEYDLGVDQWPASSILNVAEITDGPNAFLNYTHFSDPEYNALYETAATTTDPAVRKDALGKMQQILFDRGGFIIPRFSDFVFASGAAVTGWPTADPAGGIGVMKSLSNVSFQ